jgi:hypothetical protein
MDYLTNYYKNLSEQLQARVNNLQKMLDEAYPGGMTPGRSSLLHKVQLSKYSPDATSIDRARSERATNIERRGRATDARKEQMELAARHRAAEQHPDFHDTIVSHMSNEFANKFGGNNKEEVATQIAKGLHQAGGQYGFRKFHQAETALRQVMGEDPTLMDHLQNKDNIDVEFDDIIDDYHSDIAFDVLNKMTNKK